MKIDELIKLNIEYMDSIDAQKLSSMHRAQNGTVFRKTDAISELMGSFFLEIIHQQFDYFLAMNNGNKKIAMEDLTQSVESKLNFLIHLHQGKKDELH